MYSIMVFFIQSFMLLKSSGAVSQGTTVVQDTNLSHGIASIFSNDVLEMLLEAVVIAVVCGIAAIVVGTSQKRSAKGGCARKQVRSSKAFTGVGLDRTMDSALFDTEIKQLVERGDLKGCMNIFNSMRASGTIPSRSSLDALIEASIAANNFDQACGVLLDVMKFGSALHMTTVKMAISKLVNAGGLFEIESMLDELGDTCPAACSDSWAHQILIKSYASRGAADAVVRMLRKMSAQGICVDAVIFGNVLSAFQDSGPRCGDDLLRIFNAMIDSGLTSSIANLSAMLNSLARCEAWETALGFLDSLPLRFGLRPEALLYAQLGTASAKAGERAIARSIYDAMLSTVGTDAVGASASSRAFQDMILKAPSSASKVSDLATLKRVASCSLRPGGGVQHSTKNMQRLLTESSESASWRSASTTILKENAKEEVSSNPRLAQFIYVNRLDSACVDLLKSLPAAQVEWILDQEFRIDCCQLQARGSKSAHVMQTILKSKELAQDTWEIYPEPEHVAKRLAVFIQMNNLDRRCSNTLEALPLETLRFVMDKEFIIKVNSERGTASAKVIGHVMKMRKQL